MCIRDRRFRCDASGSGDFVYIDDVTITGCTFDASATNLIVTAINDGIQETPTLLSVDNNFSEQQLATTSLKVFPNPFLDNLTIQTNAKAWTVYTAFGQLVRQGVNDGTMTETTIQLGDLPAGIYLVKADREVVKIIKQ